MNPPESRPEQQGTAQTSVEAPISPPSTRYQPGVPQSHARAPRRTQHGSCRAAAREVFYLGRVGAFRYLDRIRRVLADRFAGAVADVPDDSALIPRPANHRGGTPPGHRNLSAFAVYTAAERAALDTLAHITDPADLAHIADHLAAGIAEGLRLRDTLISRGHPVPGRGQWLIPAQPDPTKGSS